MSGILHEGFREESYSGIIKNNDKESYFNLYEDGNRKYFYLFFFGNRVLMELKIWYYNLGIYIPINKQREL